MENLNSDLNGGSKVEPDSNSSHPSVQRPLDERLQKLLDKALYGGGRPGAQKVRSFLNGTWLGEPLHVVLTDLPIGAWTVAMVFDALDLLLSRHEFAVAADASIRNRNCRSSWRGSNRHELTGPMSILRRGVSD